MPSCSWIPNEITTGTAYDAEQTHMTKVVILVFGKTLGFIGYTIAKKRSIETATTINIEAGMDICIIKGTILQEISPKTPPIHLSPT